MMQLISGVFYLHTSDPNSLLERYYVACNEAEKVAAEYMGRFPTEDIVTLDCRSNLSIQAILLKKVAAYKRVAYVLGARVLLEGYTESKNAFVEQMRDSYVEVLRQFTDLVAKIDTVDNKWNERTPEVFE